MTLKEIEALARDSKVIYKGEVWKFKSIGKIGNRITVKIQRGDNILYCTSPEDIKSAD